MYELIFAQKHLLALVTVLVNGTGREYKRNFSCMFTVITLSPLLSVKAYSRTTSLEQHHQSAAKDLTGSPVRSTPSTIQVTYLPSTGHRSKRPKHFLELKSFKDNYNTLESTLWNAVWTLPTKHGGCACLSQGLHTQSAAEQRTGTVCVVSSNLWNHYCWLNDT